MSAAPPPAEAFRGIISLGPRTCERASRVLEQAMGTIWEVLVETHGGDVEQGWQVVVEGLHLEPAPPRPAAPPAPNGAPRAAAGLTGVRA
jgi:hypothetical protein